MSLSRTQKEVIFERYKGGVAVALNAFLLDYKGINVVQDTELRSKIREAGASYEVVKNTLLRLASEGKALGNLAEHLQGPTAVAYTEGDPVALAKVLSEFAKTVPAIEFKAGMVEGQAVAANEIQEIAKLPSREALLAKLLFLLQSPIVRFAQVLAAVPREFVVVLDQIAQKKGE